jgi:hypothetical protein
LYAPRFTGVKRVGERATSFDRAGWLADRERMFKRPMQVSADGVIVKIQAAVALVEFDQTWASGTYEDRGPKQLVLVRGPTGLQISREEMKKSHRVLDAKTAAALGVGFLYTPEYDKDPARYLVLSPAESGWGEGEATLLPDHEHVLKAMSKQAPPEWRALAGGLVTLYAEDGTPCTSRVEGVSILGGAVPHFYTVNVWNGRPDGIEEGPPWPDSKIAEALWDMARLYAVARLDRSDCSKNALFGWQGKKQPLAMWQVSADASVLRDAVRAYRASDAWAGIQKTYLAEHTDKEAWDAGPQTLALKSPDGSRHLVLVSASIMDGGCGDWGGTLGAVIEVRRGKTRLLWTGEAFDLENVDVFDLEGDGKVELLVIEKPQLLPDEPVFYREGEEELEPVQEFTFPFNDCSC